MKKFLCILLSLTTLMLSGCGIKNEKIRFGSAGIGGMYYTFGNAFTELASKENDKFNFEVKSTAGSAANIRLLSKNYIEMGIALPSIAQASPAVKKFISYAVESGICKATPKQ